MIHSSTVYPAYGITSNLTVALQPVKNLYPLVKASMGPKVIAALSDDDTVLSEQDMLEDSRQKLDGLACHDEAMKQLVELAVLGVKRTFNTARGTVNPLCIEAEQFVTKYVEENLVKNNEIVINVVKDPVIAKNGMFNRMMERYIAETGQRSVVSVNIFNGKAWRDLSAEERQTFMTTGVASLDEQIPEMLIELKMDNVDPFEVSNGDDVNSLAVKYMLLLHATKHIPEGIDMSLEAFQANIAIARSNLGSRYSMEIDRLNRAVRAKALFVRNYVNPYDTSVNVYAPVYNQWLKDGGSPEIIMGMMRSGKAELNGERLLARADYYKNVLANYYKTMQAEVMTKTNGSQRRAIHIFFSKYIVEELDSSVHHTAKQRLDEYLAKRWKLADENLVFFLRRLVCDVFFEGTDILRVLSEIQQVQNANEGMDVREASEVVFINWVGDWLTTLVTPTKA